MDCSILIEGFEVSRLRSFWHWSVAGTGGAGAKFSEMLVWNLFFFEALQW